MDLKKYKLKLILLITLVIALYSIPLDYIEKRSFCIFYNLFNFKCLGCGFTRAFFNFTRMNILRAISYNKMILLLGPIIVYIFLDELIHTIKVLRNKQVNSHSIISKILNFIFKD